VFVVATAGHVDHGKSTLVRALTGMEPDRWAEERQRGMTIDLGYAWFTLPTGETVAFVDVPGHQRFIGNMLAGLGPSPAVVFVVAADEGWRRQSSEHLAAIDALGLCHGLLVVTRSDLADPSAALAQAQAKIARSSLGAVAAVAVSGPTGAGLEELRAALHRLVAALPPPDPAARVRLWVDRSFVIRGSGTVVTGTLSAGTIAVHDELELRGTTVHVRGLHSLGRSVESASGAARVAVNLRSVPRDAVGRGDALLAPGAWRWTQQLDARLNTAEVPAELVLHLGSAAVPVRVRPLGGAVVRLRLDQPLPIQVGDRAILRDPGRQSVAAGLEVLDPDPPELRRRGAAARRAAELAAGPPNLTTEVGRRGVVRRSDLAALGVPLDELDRIREVADWLVAPPQWSGWTQRLRALAAESLPVEAARRRIGVPDRRLMRNLVADAGLTVRHGRVQHPGAVAQLGAAEASIVRLEDRLRAQPFRAPERSDLRELGLGNRDIAIAVEAERLLRLSNDVVLLPSAPAAAVATLNRLPQPFTTSDARQALDTTRRVVIPLLEHLDAQGWTRRLDDSYRTVIRGPRDVRRNIGEFSHE
jgi:selenocysteine-specific elongation factor